MKFNKDCQDRQTTVQWSDRINRNISEVCSYSTILPYFLQVLAEKQHLLHQRNIDPKRAKARGGREPILKVFVGGLDPSVSEAEIKDYFKKYGKVSNRHSHVLFYGSTFAMMI